MRYKVTYEFEGHLGNMKYLEPGDEILLEDGTVAKIMWVVQRGSDFLYGTDCMGVVYSRELSRGWRGGEINNDPPNKN